MLEEAMSPPDTGPPPKVNGVDATEAINGELYCHCHHVSGVTFKSCQFSKFCYHALPLAIGYRPVLHPSGLCLTQQGLVGRNKHQTGPLMNSASAGASARVCQPVSVTSRAALQCGTKVLKLKRQALACYE